MPRILLAPYGSLGDLHPFIALGLELRARGHEVRICTMEAYREKIATLGFPFFPLRPSLDPEDKDLARQLMDPNSGTENLVRNTMLGSINETHEDLISAADGMDMLVAGEIVFPSYSVSELKRIPLATTTLAPFSLMSARDSVVFPNGIPIGNLGPFGVPLRALSFAIGKRLVNGWLGAYRDYRKSLGLDPAQDPLFHGKFSDDLHLVMFSRALAEPKPDWPRNGIQTGFCFYDGEQDLGKLDPELEEFMKSGGPAVVFTLGSAASMDAGDFFDESLKLAKMLDLRAVFVYGQYGEPPKGLDEKRRAFDYAPYGSLFPMASCVVHQGGVGTTSQVLRAGVPHLVVPFAHDQPDNAYRIWKSGAGEYVLRRKFNARSARKKLERLLGRTSYKANALVLKGIIDTEDGTVAACNAIEKALMPRTQS
ncbi:MAG: glycosyltransferase [Pyrinomonadaceae bacterium]